MHFSLPLPKSLILLSLLQHISFAAPAAEPIPAPAPIPVLGARNNSPITLPYFSSGAALEIKSGETRVYYQSEDGAIHELSGFNSPDSGNAYTDNIILPAGEARKGTPLAVTDLTLTFVIRLYYIAPNNQLKELINDNDGQGWRAGDLNSYNIFTRPKSKYLYAISVPFKFNPRVGYQSPEGYLSEAGFDPATLKWNTFVF